VHGGVGFFVPAKTPIQLSEYRQGADGVHQTTMLKNEKSTGASANVATITAVNKGCSNNSIDIEAIFSCGQSALHIF